VQCCSLLWLIVISRQDASSNLFTYVTNLSDIAHSCAIKELDL